MRKQNNVLKDKFRGGDTDTISCMAGGIAGAFLGIEHIPLAWIEHVEDSKYFLKLADELLLLF